MAFRSGLAADSLTMDGMQMRRVERCVAATGMVGFEAGNTLESMERESISYLVSILPQRSSGVCFVRPLILQGLSGTVMTIIIDYLLQ